MSEEIEWWRAQLPRFSPRLQNTYDIRSLLGDGSLGVVLLAHQRNPEREVAFKVIRTISEEDRQRFLREAPLLLTLEHPRIVRVYEMDCDGIIPYIASELVNGVSLKEKIQRHQCTVREALRISIHVLEAIAFAHSRGLLHRNVKPGNIFLDSNQDVRVSEFGLAPPAVTVSQLTAASAAVGAADYVAPEGVEGQRVGPAVRWRSRG
jgi:serine/threonine protein kinase